MKFGVFSNVEHRAPADLIVLPFWQGGIEAMEMSEFKMNIAPALSSGDFKGKLGETILLYVDGTENVVRKEPRLLLLGLGKEATAESIRRSVAAAVRFAKCKKYKTVNFMVPKFEGIKNGLSAYLEGLILTNYTFAELKGVGSPESAACTIEQIGLIGLQPEDENLLKKIETTLSGVFWVRDLVNRNADDKIPAMIAKMVRELAAKSSNLQVKILTKVEIEKEKMGLLLAVNRSSAHEPSLIELSYRGNPASDEHIVLVGKGITYDTGGLSLKPTDGMLTMKCDMSGAATVLAAVDTAAKLGLKVNVTAVTPLTENMLGSLSYKPGDVYVAHNGKTVEITNTDAEGRLVLADAMSYAVKQLKPTYMVDIASLTGGMIIAVGDEMAGLFTPHDELANKLLSASEQTDELLWRMPMNPDYKESLKSEVGDLVNSTGRAAGPIKAAFFLQEFTEQVPWAHIDFAGPCFLDKPKHYNTTSATGFGVRLLIKFLEQFK